MPILLLHGLSTSAKGSQVRTKKIDTGSHIHTVDPVGYLGLPIEVAVYARDVNYPNQGEWLEASADASDIEAAIMAVRTLLTDTDAPHSRIEIRLIPGKVLVQGVVTDSATDTG